ncbi:MAG: aminotransferase class V-fold PLP-dependent enzyme [Bryobacteraceae bacterium]|nr:aminotransferase class V-fold PLP-dependent enzyme [Bryobacteraceae bacterium]
MPHRRGFIKTLAGLPLIGGLVPGSRAMAAARRDYFKELGLRPFLNAAGTYTTLTASLMPKEVAEAWLFASKTYVPLIELHDAVGKRIASLIGCEAAMVSAGAASALTLGTAACVAGTNREFIQRIPDVTGMKSEVIIQKEHRFGYDRAVRNVGIRFVEVETREDFERAINPKTAMMLFLNYADPKGQVKAAEFVEIGKKHGVPTFIDCAADVPPASNLSRYTKMGFDLVTFSGGKGLCGPQSAGLLLGRKDLIEAARLNAAPYSESLGRGMKVNKEELLAMMVAVERYLARDEEAEMAEFTRRANHIVDSVASIPGVKTEIQIPEIANHVPHVHIWWDESQIKTTVPEVVRMLREGEPSIEVVPGSKEHLMVNAWMLQPGEVKIVARRIRELLNNGKVS